MSFALIVKFLQKNQKSEFGKLENLMKNEYFLKTTLSSF